MKIERYLVQFQTQAGAWRDAFLINGDIALFEDEDDAHDFDAHADGLTRVVVLEGEVWS